MSDSYPTIQESLSEMQKQFLGAVEAHLDPPEFITNTYSIEALYAHDEGEAEVPGNAIRFVVAVDDSDGEVSERHHVVEFLELDEAGRAEHVGHIRHSMKRIEASQGRAFWTESRFEVEAPDLPRGSAFEEDVEQEVEVYIERLKTLDRAHRLRELA